MALNSVYERLFQSTLPQGERRSALWPPQWPHQFQSTLPQGERPARRYLPPHCLGISIHAPARGATIVPNPSRAAGLISIHAPARGATCRSIAGGTWTSQFQSTLPQGERPTTGLSWSAPTKFQSTLPQGERHVAPHYLGNSSRFQSTLPQGERRNLLKGWIVGYLFQSTLPQGERPLLARSRALMEMYFNPRSRKGSDGGCCNIMTR